MVASSFQLSSLISLGTFVVSRWVLFRARHRRLIFDLCDLAIQQIILIYAQMKSITVSLFPTPLKTNNKSHINIESHVIEPTLLDHLDLNHLETLNLLRYSFFHGHQIILRILQSPGHIQQLLQLLKDRRLVLQTQLLQYFFTQVKYDSDLLTQIACAEAQSFDKETRASALVCLATQTIRDERFMLSLIQKANDSAEIILSTGTKGLLISVLEDQYAVVRINAIRVIQNLVRQSSKFALNVLEILIYMLNDEMDIVRIEAVRVIERCYPKVEFNKSEINSLKFNLFEQNLKLRISIYSLLGLAVFSERSVLFDVFNNIVQNLNRFPQDFTYIAKALKQLGIRNHSILTIAEILQNRERIYQEPDWMNQEYLLRMIYAYHSTDRSPADPFYFNKHFDYFSDNNPEFFRPHQVKYQDLLSQQLFHEYKQLVLKFCENKGLLINQQLMKKVVQAYEKLGALFEIHSPGISVQPILEFDFEASLIDQLQHLQDLKTRMKSQLELEARFSAREFKFISPIMNQNFKVQPEYFLQFKVSGEFTNLKEPITKHYAFQLIYQDQNTEEHKLCKQDVEDGMINTYIQIGRIIVEISQSLKIQLVQMVNEGEPIPIGKGLEIYLQV